jgi:2-iminobutanoate/2-iminopropanoate deaminase
MRKAISTDKAPKAIGPYAQAIKTDHYLFISGQLAIEPATGKLIDSGIKPQTSQVLQNILGILQAAGLDPSRLVKTTVYLRNMEDFAAMNEIYADVLGKNPPARACVEVSRLPKDALIEIEAIALV